jgi:hypothetical protein
MEFNSKHIAKLTRETIRRITCSFLEGCNSKHIAKLEGNNKAHNWQLVEGCNSKHIAKLMRETIRQ